MAETQLNMIPFHSRETGDNDFLHSHSHSFNDWFIFEEMAIWKTRDRFVALGIITKLTKEAVSENKSAGPRVVSTKTIFKNMEVILSWPQCVRP